MTWLALLLADSSPCLRWHVLRELLHRPEDDPEVRELAALRAADPLVHDLVALQEVNGSWQSDKLGWHGGPIQTTAQALARLGYLGLGPADDAVRRGAEYLWQAQQEDGSWPLPSGREGDDEREGYDCIPLQTALPLRGLAACGYATDPRAERAYEWLLAQRLEDGAWPTGFASGTLGYVAGYRRLPHSRWGCRSNTTGALCCLAYHPERRHSTAARRALDLLLGRETRDAYALGFEVVRLLGAEPTRGFITFFARFDLALVLGLCSRVGADRCDPRVVDLVTFIQTQQGPYGLWEYAAMPQMSRWVTYDLLRSLSMLDDHNDWISQEPRTPFQPYPRRPSRY